MFNKRKPKESDCCRYCSFVTSDGDKYICKFKGEVKSGSLCRRFKFNPFAHRIPRVRNLDTTMFDPLDFKID